MFSYKKFTYVFNKIIKQQYDITKLLLSNNIYFKLSAIIIIIKQELNIIPFNYQIIGALKLFYNINIEMHTGEGKSITILIASILLGLNKRKIHIMTSNNYLALRDYNNFKNIFKKCKLIVGFINENSDVLKQNIRNIYKNSNIIYISVNTITFHFLKDLQMFFDFKKENIISRDILIIDEIDQIIMDYNNDFILSSKNSIVNKFDIKKIDKIYKFISLFKKYANNKNLIIDLKGKNIFIKKNLQKIINQKINKFYPKQKQLHIIIFFLIKKFFFSCFFVQKGIDYIIDTNNNIQIIAEHTGRINNLTSFREILNFCIIIKENLSYNNILITESCISILLNNFIKYYKRFCGASGTILSLEFKLQFFSNNLKIFKVPRRKKKKLIKHKDVICNNQFEKLIILEKIINKSINTTRPIIIITQNIKECNLIYNFLIKKINAIYYKIFKLSPDNIIKEQYIIDNIGDFGNILITTKMCSRGTDIKLGTKKNINRINQLLMIKKIDLYKKIELIKLKRHYNKLLNCRGFLLIIFEHSKINRSDQQIEGRVARQGEPGEIIYLLSPKDKIFLTSFNPFLNMFPLEERIPILQRNYENSSFQSNMNNTIYDSVLDNLRQNVFHFKNNIFFNNKLFIKYIRKLFIKFLKKDFNYFNIGIEQLKINQIINLKKLKIFLLKIIQKIIIDGNNFYRNSIYNSNLSFLSGEENYIVFKKEFICFLNKKYKYYLNKNIKNIMSVFNKRSLIKKNE